MILHASLSLSHFFHCSNRELSHSEREKKSEKKRLELEIRNKLHTQTYGSRKAECTQSHEGEERRKKSSRSLVLSAVWQIHIWSERDSFFSHIKIRKEEIESSLNRVVIRSSLFSLSSLSPQLPYHSTAHSRKKFTKRREKKVYNKISIRGELLTQIHLPSSRRGIWFLLFRNGIEK